MYKSDSQALQRCSIVTPCSSKLAPSNNHSRLRREYGGEARRLKIARRLSAWPRPASRFAKSGGPMERRLRIFASGTKLHPSLRATPTDRAMDRERAPLSPLLGFGHAAHATVGELLVTSARGGGQRTNREKKRPNWLLVIKEFTSFYPCTCQCTC